MRAALVLSIVSSAALLSRTASTAELVGSWRLVANQEHRADGRVSDVWGSDPLGRLVYDARGRVSMQILNRHRRAFAGNDRAGGTPEETREAFVGFLSYFGTYTVDEKAGTVVHHVAGASFPNLMGTDQRRRFVLEGNRLTLSTPPILANGRTSTYVLVWEREE